MPNQFFRFKQFTIQQEHCAMKVGTDGVLLGAWAIPHEVADILDVGTGTGLIAIMLAQKSQARIDAVEMDLQACQQAADNAKKTPWGDRIRVIHASFQDFSKRSEGKYGLIVSNPPFFTNSLKADQETRNLARHNDTLPPGELLLGISRLLTSNGRFCVILPYIDSSLFIVDAALHGLYCVRKTTVKPTRQKKPFRVLMEFCCDRSKIEESEVIIHAGDGNYTDDYRLLTRDYYLFS